MLSDSKDLYKLLKTQTFTSTVFQQNSQPVNLNQIQQIKPKDSLVFQDKQPSSINTRNQDKVQNKILQIDQQELDQKQIDGNILSRRYQSTPKARKFSELVGDYDEKNLALMSCKSDKKTKTKNNQKPPLIAGQIKGKLLDEFKIQALYQKQQNKIKEGEHQKSIAQSNRSRSSSVSKNSTKDLEYGAQNQNYFTSVTLSQQSRSKIKNSKGSLQQDLKYNQDQSQNYFTNPSDQYSSIQTQQSTKNYLDNYYSINNTKKENENIDSLESTQRRKQKELYLFGLSQFFDIQSFKDLFPSGMSLLSFNYQNQTVTTNFKGRARIIIQYDLGNSDHTNQNLMNEFRIRLASKGIKFESRTPKLSLQNPEKNLRDPRQMICHSPAKKNFSSYEFLQIEEPSKSYIHQQVAGLRTQRTSVSTKSQKPHNYTSQISLPRSPQNQSSISFSGSQKSIQQDTKKTAKYIINQIRQLQQNKVAQKQIQKLMEDIKNKNSNIQVQSEYTPTSTLVQKFETQYSNRSGYTQANQANEYLINYQQEDEKNYEQYNEIQDIQPYNPKFQMVKRQR